MWAYSVLVHLPDDPAAPVRTQAALSDAIGADRTRIIEVLDDLQDQGLISRDPDPADRRARLIGLTAKGRSVRDAAQNAVQRNERHLLDRIPADERDRFLRTLHRLAALAAELY